MLYKNKFVSELAVANRSGAMEAETISKNGYSSKSQISRANIFLLIVALTFFTVITAFAQGDFAINDNLGKGVYIRIGGGYSFGAGKVSLWEGNYSSDSYRSRITNQTGTVVEDEDRRTSISESNPFSLGKGMVLNFEFGYMLNSYLGIELGGNYLSGSTSFESSYKSHNHNEGWQQNWQTGNVERHYLTQVSSGSETNTMSYSSFQLTPAIKINFPIKNSFSFYSRVGISLPIINIMTSEMKDKEKSTITSNNNPTGNVSDHGRNHKMEITSYFKLGYMGSIGVNFNISDNIGVFVETNARISSFQAKKGTVTERTETVRDASGRVTTTNYLDVMDVYEKETEFLKKYEYTYDRNNQKPEDKDKPRKEMTISLPTSGIGIAAGLIFKF